MSLTKKFRFWSLAGTLVFCGTMLRAETVPIAQGTVAGASGTAPAGRYESFLGIPFAAPPVGNLRWAPPSPALPFPKGRLEATKYAPACLQSKNDMASQGPVEGSSEDCLYLNVWRPEGTAADSRLPVLVFIHGGGNTVGAAGLPFFEGAQLAAASRLVVVTIQYRLGLLGFLAHSELSRASAYPGSGNYGVLDQIAALRWVQSHITAFGGDKNRVTVFGESAGANAIAALLASPLARPLFRSAILESTPVGTYTREEAQARGQLATRKLCGVPSSTAKLDLVACLRALTPAAILSAQGPSVPTIRSGMYFRPVVDQYVLKDDPMVAFRAQTDKTVLIGSNLDEMIGFIPLNFSLSETETFLREKLGADFDRLLQLQPQKTKAQKLMAMAADAFFSCPSRQLLDSLVDSGNRNVYQYHYAHVAEVAGAPVLPVTHGAELLPVFGRFTGSLLGSADNQVVQKQIMSFWANLAYSGDPNSGPFPSALRFPAYSAAADYVEIKETSRLQIHSAIQSRLAEPLCSKLRTVER